MLFQHASELAIRATVFLARQAPGKLSPVHEIAAQTDVSEAYLAKILQRLSAAGFIRSFRGPGKGMELGRPANKITLASLILVMEGSRGAQEFPFGLGTGSGETSCVLHDEWIPIRTAIRNFLKNTTLADLAESAPAQAARFGVRKVSGLRGPAKAESCRGRRHS
jgi:Rrf2 family transcriptional regulator, iron-sulfur cluster assembly transcription factor